MQASGVPGERRGQSHFLPHASSHLDSRFCDLQVSRRSAAVCWWAPFVVLSQLLAAGEPCSAQKCRLPLSVATRLALARSHREVQKMMPNTRLCSGWFAKLLSHTRAQLGMRQDSIGPRWRPHRAACKIAFGQLSGRNHHAVRRNPRLRLTVGPQWRAPGCTLPAAAARNVKLPKGDPIAPHPSTAQPTRECM